MQDSKGYLWISTEIGLCRYNGTKVMLFNKKNGLNEGATYTVSEDNNGTIWATTAKNRVLKYENETLSEANFSNQYVKMLFKGDITYQTHIKGKNDIYLTSTNSTFKVNTQSNTINKVSHSDTAYYYFHINDDILCINKLPRKRIITKSDITSDIIIHSEYGKIRIPIKHKYDELISYRVITHKHGKWFLFAINNILYKVDKYLNYSVHKMPSTIISLFTDKGNGLWVGMYQHGVYYYKNDTALNDRIHSLNGYSVSGICEDHENGIWCTTLEKGVFYSGNKKILCHNNLLKRDRQAEMLKNIDGKIIIAIDPGKITMLLKGGKEKQDYYFKTRTPIQDIVTVKKKRLLGGAGFIIWADEQFKPKTYINFVNKKILYSNKIVKAGDTRTFSLSYNILQEIKANNVEDITKLNNHIKNALYIGNNTLLLGSSSGLYNFNLKTKLLTHTTSVKGEVVKMIATTDSMVWIATKSDGIYRMSQDSAVYIKQYLRTKADNIYDIATDISDNLWLGTNAGLTKITPADSGYKAITYNTVNGLPDNEIYNIATDSQNIYLSTVSGVFSFPLNEDLQNHTSPQIHFNYIKVNNVEYNYSSSNLSLPHDSNSLKISIDLLSFKRTRDTKQLHYTLNDIEYSHLINTDNEIILSNLKPGKYKFTAYGVNSDGVKSKNSITINFIIRPPFWMTFGFVSLISLVGIGVVYLLIRQATKRVRKKEEEKTRINTLIAESQLSALQAQMNPHFIFNAINSIQNYILKNEPDIAYDYLAKFSKLIRLVLNNSQEKTITLHDELETIKLYITLEQMRFKNSFDYTLNIHDEVDIHHIEVPVMLVQPYIENAIWHGLMHIGGTRRGILNIDINYEFGSLKLSITDNGIGRLAANKYQKEKLYRPVALKLTARRLDMIHKMQGYAGTSVIITDLKGENNEPSGTKVDVLLPIIEN